MRTKAFLGLIPAVFIGVFLLLPSTVLAQSSIAGQVRDASGGVLPGVTVEIASPVLIEKVRTAITDQQGLYNVVDLRPGTYQVTFILAGFQKLLRSGIELPANFSATINADLSIGALEETITVTGQGTLIDLRQASQTQVLTREMIDTLPTSRNMQSVGTMTPGVKQNSPDVGGSQLTRSNQMSVHGASGLHTSMQVDGMIINAAMGDGNIQNYVNQDLYGEVAVQTSGITADVSAGGVRVNAIPKDGGNIFSGNVFMSGVQEAWQSNNLTQELKDRGVTTPNRILHIRDLNGSLGGPIKRDKLWFFTSARWISVDENVVGAVNPDGSAAVIDQFVRQPLLRLTWQARSNTKVAAFFERTFKYQSHGDFSPGVEPSRAAQERILPCSPFAIGQAKITSTLSSRMLWETGYSTNIERNCFVYRGGIQKAPFTPEWYANASHSDFISSEVWWAPTAGQRTADTDRKVFSSSFSYVTGSHNFKTGAQWSFGQDAEHQSLNADLIQEYRQGVPERVRVRNTPTRYRAYVNYDLGLYAQDSWTFKRLTLNPGIRFEIFNAEMHAQELPPGRFVPFRSFPAQKDSPNWRDVAPRFSAVYDLFGTGTTAVKGSISKYVRPMTGSFAKRYSPIVISEDTRDWFDVDLLPGTATPSGRALPTNGDDIAQDNEIGPSNNRNFGVAQSRRPVDGLEREYNVEYAASVQHQLTRRLAVTFGYYRREYGNLEWSDNVLLTPADYAGFQATNPLNGEIFTVYNLVRAKQGLVDLIDRNSDVNEQIYNGFELSFNTRLPNGSNVFGGWTTDQNLTNTCQRSNPNLGGGRFCDQTAFGMPHRSDFKLAGNYPIPFGGLDVAASFISYAGAPLSVNWAVPANLFPGGRTEAVTVPLIQPGTKFLDRWNQLDANVKKILRIGNKEYTGQVAVFNMLNSSVVLAENQNFGNQLGQPQRFLQGRIMRLSMQVKW
jgi:hypothetical protein